MDLRYPIGPFAPPKESLTAEERRRSIDQIAEAPAKLREAVAGLSTRQLETPYRPDGWTVRQVAHHVPDSHINAYVRFKLALTEDRPALQTYEESEWARLPDTTATPVEVSLTLLDALHRRWVALLRARRKTLPNGAPSLLGRRHRGLLSPSTRGGRHHVAHITTLRERMGWGE